MLLTHNEQRSSKVLLDHVGVLCNVVPGCEDLTILLSKQRLRLWNRCLQSAFPFLQRESLISTLIVHHQAGRGERLCSIMSVTNMRYNGNCSQSRNTRRTMLHWTKTASSKRSPNNGNALLWSHFWTEAKKRVFSPIVTSASYQKNRQQIKEPK